MFVKVKGSYDQFVKVCIDLYLVLHDLERQVKVWEKNLKCIVLTTPF